MPAQTKKSSFASDVLKLVSGTTFSQIMVLMATPVLTRLYHPEAFGINSLFLSISNIVVMISCMRYQLAIMLPENDDEAINVFSLSLVFNFLITVLTCLLLLDKGRWLAGLVREPALAGYLWLLPLTVLFGGGFSVLNNWNLRTRHFSRLAFNRMMSSVISVGTKVGAGAAGHVTAGSMIAGNLLGSGIPSVILFGQVVRDDGARLFRSIRWKTMIRMLKRYRQFLIYDTWSTLLNNVSWQLPAFLLSYFFSSSIVGYYSLGLNILRMPMGFVGQSISQVFFQRAAEARNEGNLAPLVESVFKRLVLFSLFPMLVLTIVGREVFIVVCGANWAEAGVFTEILSVWTFFWFISSPLSMLMAVLEKQKFNLVWNSFNFTTRFLSLWIGGMMGSARLALTLFAVSGVLIYGGLCAKIIRESGVRWSRIYKILMSNFLIFLPAGCFLAAMKYFGLSPLIISGATVFVFCLYGVYILKSDARVQSMLMKPFKRKPVVLPIDVDPDAQ